MKNKFLASCWVIVLAPRPKVRVSRSCTRAWRIISMSKPLCPKKRLSSEVTKAAGRCLGISARRRNPGGTCPEGGRAPAVRWALAVAELASNSQHLRFRLDGAARIHSDVESQGFPGGGVERKGDRHPQFAAQDEPCQGLPNRLGLCSEQ